MTTETRALMDSTAANPARGLRVAGSVTTAIFATMMTISGALFILGAPPVVAAMRQLGYPDYFRSVLGAAKLLGVAALLLPPMRGLREWAYAGFTFTLVGAFASHLLSGDGVLHAAPSVLSLGLLLVSYFLRQRIATAGGAS